MTRILPILANLLCLFYLSYAQKHNFTFDDKYNGKYLYSLYSNPIFTNLLPEDAKGGFTYQDANGLFVKSFTQQKGPGLPRGSPVKDVNFEEKNTQIVDNSIFSQLKTSSYILSNDGQFIAYITDKI